MQQQDFRSFNRAFLLACLAFLALGALGVAGLQAMGRLPPPPLTATNCIDEKFRFMRNEAPPDPDLIAVGSSVTWRNLDFASVGADQTGAKRPFNAAPCFLQVSQTAYLTDFYLDHMPSVRTVLSVFAMRDFETCTGDGSFFDRRLAAGYVFGGWPALPIYFVNFRPRSFFSDIQHIKDMRSGEDHKFTLVMDRFGSGPLRLDRPDIQDDVRFSEACLPFLARMERDLAARGIRWIVVLMPPMPAWLERYDPEGARDRAWRDAVRSTLRLPGTVLIDGEDGPVTATAQFTDPAHFHWKWVPAFTRWIFDRANATGSMHAARG